MSSRLSPVVVALALALALPGCEAVAGIFRAGFWVGILIAAVVIAVVVAIARRAR
jgi:hypothetical protein